MQITHEYLKKYSYLRSNPKNQPPITQIQVEKSAKQEESVQAIMISEQNEKLETEIQQPAHYDVELFALNEQAPQQEELSQSLKKTIKTTPTRRNLIFEPLIRNNLNQQIGTNNPPINKQNHLMIVQQYNMLIDLHQKPKEIIEVNQSNQQQNLSEEKEIQQSVEQLIEQQIFNPFEQQKEISMYVDQSQVLEQPLQEQQLSSHEQEQKFLQNEQMDPDYNKEDYLKVIENYIEFIKIVEYMDKNQIEQQILKHQHITSKKKYLLIVEPLIQLMLFEQLPENPFKKDTQTIHSSVDYVAFYDILKLYKTQLEEQDYIQNLSHFMHYQLSQQTIYFLQIKKEQIKWNPVLFQELQNSRIELSLLLKIYEQLQQEPLYLLDQDIQAFQIQISNMHLSRIKVFQLLFSKYKKKIQLKLKQLKRNNKNQMLSSTRNKQSSNQFPQYEEAKDTLYIKLQDLRDIILQHDSTNNFELVQHLLQQFSEIQKLLVKIQKQETLFVKQGIMHDPIQISLEQDAIQIFSLLQADIKAPSQKAKVLLRSKVGEFSWQQALSQEHQELKNMMLRYSKIVEFYDQVRNQFSEELNFIKTLKFGKQIFSQNILLLTQYLFIKQELAHTEISIFAYPLQDFQQITVSSSTYSNLIKETNNKVIAIQQLKQYKIVETLTRILSSEDYQLVYKQLTNMRNTLNLVNFSSIISEQINIVIQYIKISLVFFPKNILQVYSQTETYQDLEENLGDIAQLKQLKKTLNNQTSDRIFEIFQSFFEKKVQNEFNWIFEHLIELSNQECDYNDLQYLQNRLDLLYDFQRSDMNNKYTRLELVGKIRDQSNVRDLINIGRGLFEELTIMVNEDNENDDISFNNQKIIEKILEIDYPNNINPQLSDFSSLLSYHKSLQLYPNEQTFLNSQLNLGLLVFEEYQKYLTACQHRVRQLLSCSIIKVNTLKIEALQNILFKTTDMTEFVPIGDLHEFLNYCYSDVQSVMILQNKHRIHITQINGRTNDRKQAKLDSDIEIQIQYQNTTGVGVYIDDMILFICE